ncbi:MAG: DegV family protein [Chloroflexi bacterium]|nr:DegV family protein [Chloroflexota bacterium]
MSRVAIVTDSASDMPPDVAAAAGIGIVPLVVTFGSETFKAGTELTTDDFWRRMTAPDAPFPTTAASSPGDFKAAYDKAFADGADSIVSIHVAGTLSGTLKAAQIARGMLPDREIHIVDSGSASMGEGLLAELAIESADLGHTAAEVARLLEDRARDIDLYVALDTLEYLKKGGRISGARAAIGTLLSVKPIITIRDGVVETADKPRTTGKARVRVIELLTQRPLERLAILYTPPADGEGFRREVLERLGGSIDPARVSIQPVGASVGPHIGPGCLGGVVLYQR